MLEDHYKIKREDGLYLGSFAPYGYVKDPNNKNKLIVDPVAAEVVKEIFFLICFWCRIL